MIQIRIQSLASLQKLSVQTLEDMSRAVGNRQYALACGYMANAQRAFERGDRGLMMAYVERAKVAHARAQEDDRGQARRMLGLA